MSSNESVLPENVQMFKDEMIFLFLYVDVEVDPPVPTSVEPETWPTVPPKWDGAYYLYTAFFENFQKKEGRKVKINTILEKSDRFVIRAPYDNILCKTLKPKVGIRYLEDNINSAHPIMHEHALKLVMHYLYFKRRLGSSDERALYTEHSLMSFIDRLLLKQNISYCDYDERFILLDGRRGYGNIAELSRKYHPSYCRYLLVPDEVRLASFIGFSSKSYVINKGGGRNEGLNEFNRAMIEQECIVIGVCGPKIDVHNFLDHCDVNKTKKQNRQVNGYLVREEGSAQQLFSTFYEVPVEDYERTRFKGDYLNSNFLKIHEDGYFDKKMYQKRLAITFDMLLIEANARAEKLNQSAFVHVPRFGLSSDQKNCINQETLFMNCLYGRIKFLGPNLKYISDVVVPNMRFKRMLQECQNEDKIAIDGHPNGGITVSLENRENFQKLDDKHQGKILIVGYETTANSIAGNEFWCYRFNDTDTSTLACACQITELHNPHINPRLNADHLKILKIDGKILHISDYLKEQERATLSERKEWDSVYKQKTNDTEAPETSKDNN